MHASIDGQYFYKDRTLKSVNFFNCEPDLDELSVYEVFRVEDSIPLFIEEHLERFRSSAQIAGVVIKKSNNQILQAIGMLIAANTIENGNIKIDFRKKPSGEKQFLVHFVKANYPGLIEKTEGVIACFQNAVRTRPSAKIYNSGVRDKANSIIDERHVFETILVNDDGLMTEGSRSNLFFIADDIVYTAPEELVLSGIIRSKVLQIVHEKGITIRFEALKQDLLPTIEAAFISGTTPRILPLKQIEQFNFNPSHVIIQELYEALRTKINLYKKKVSM